MWVKLWAKRMASAGRGGYAAKDAKAGRRMLA
jgi:hypothetical protein